MYLFEHTLTRKLNINQEAREVSLIWIYVLITFYENGNGWKKLQCNFMTFKYLEILVDFT